MALWSSKLLMETFVRHYAPRATPMASRWGHARLNNRIYPLPTHEPVYGEDRWPAQQARCAAVSGAVVSAGCRCANWLASGVLVDC